jgi:hypothetical protein
MKNKKQIKIGSFVRIINNQSWAWQYYGIVCEEISLNQVIIHYCIHLQGGYETTFYKSDFEVLA